MSSEKFSNGLAFCITILKSHDKSERRCVMSNQPEIDVQRRRKADKPTERAEAPVRRQTGSGGGGPSRPSMGGGFNIPTKGKMGGCGGGLVLLFLNAYIR